MESNGRDVSHRQRVVAAFDAAEEFQVCDDEVVFVAAVQVNLADANVPEVLGVDPLPRDLEDPNVR